VNSLPTNAPVRFDDEMRRVRRAEGTNSHCSSSPVAEPCDSTAVPLTSAGASKTISERSPSSALGRSSTFSVNERRASLPSPSVSVISTCALMSW